MGARERRAKARKGASTEGDCGEMPRGAVLAQTQMHRAKQGWAMSAAGPGHHLIGLDERIGVFRGPDLADGADEGVADVLSHLTLVVGLVPKIEIGARPERGRVICMRAGEVASQRGERGGPEMTGDCDACARERASRTRRVRRVVRRCTRARTCNG